MHPESVKPDTEHAEIVLSPSFVTNAVVPDIKILVGPLSPLAPLFVHPESVNPETEHAETELPKKFVTNAVVPDITILVGV